MNMKNSELSIEWIRAFCADGTAPELADDDKLHVRGERTYFHVRGLFANSVGMKGCNHASL
jgi:hypothetical protein